MNEQCQLFLSVFKHCCYLVSIPLTHKDSLTALFCMLKCVFTFCFQTLYSHDKEQMITLSKEQVEECHTQLETIKSTPIINST